MTEKYQENEKLIKAWKMVSKDLGIQIEVSFSTNFENEELKYDILIKNFGSELGTLVVKSENKRDFVKAIKLGYYCSELNPNYYEKYNRDNFIETLNDWGYYGQEENKPE